MCCKQLAWVLVLAPVDTCIVLKKKVHEIHLQCLHVGVYVECKHMFAMVRLLQWVCLHVRVCTFT